MDAKVLPGRPEPLGATPADDSINFAVYARHATALRLLVFDTEEANEPRIVNLDPVTHRSNDVWHVALPAEMLGAARYYAYQADGPHEGPHRYDPEKVLVDPYAHALHFPAGHARSGARGPGSTLGRAPVGVLPTAATAFDWSDDVRPNHPPHRRVIYELHVKGFTKRDPTVPEAHRGTYLGVVDKIPYLRALGVTTVELLPVQQFDPDEDNYWGYMTLGFFAVHADYAATDDPSGEFKVMVRALHEAGIEVLLDVVYNHTTEEDDDGPTYSFRGLDNATYYVQTEDGRGYRDDAGTGNVFKTAHPQVRRLVLDSLRHWATEYRVDGFRYDLASILTRNIAGFPDPHGALVPGISHDPVLQPLLHIAEPWDLAAYQVGTSFPGASWAQWNDKFRDDTRRFVKSDPGFVTAMMMRLTASPDVFPPGLPHVRKPHQSINFIIAHDGFCLNDLVSYNAKHNDANGHGGQDGASVNFSWNCGFEGEDDAPVDVLNLRRRQRKNFLTLLMLANGVPMIYMGDEFANTQGGNNNPYNQDNETAWLDWSRHLKFQDLLRFTSQLTAFRQRHDGFARLRNGQVQWFGVDGYPDVSPSSRSLAFALPADPAGSTEDIYVMINAYWEALTFEIQYRPDAPWRRRIDTINPSPTDFYEDAQAPAIESPAVRVGPRSIVVLVAPSVSPDQ